jgi:DNA-binding beta-propeller fold protein YncE
VNYSGDGVLATSTSLYRPSGVAVDKAGNLYVADTNNARIRRVDTNGIISLSPEMVGSATLAMGDPRALLHSSRLWTSPLTLQAISILPIRMPT